MDRDRIEIVALVGSVRERSFNRGMLHTAMLLRPDDVHITEFPIHTLPFFNPDSIEAGGLPMVRDLRETARQADAVLVCTPEYAYGMPGVLKNALDWLSVPRGRSLMRGKPVAIASASIDRNGTVRAQMQTRQAFLSMGAVVLPEPEVYVTFAEDKFNQLGELTDHSARDQIKLLVESLADWAELLKGQR